MCRIVVVLAAVALLIAPAAAAAAPELSTTDRLQDRRYVAAGDHSYVVGYEDGTFPAQGWHVPGEMGGVWSQPLKLLDGVWFGVGDQWLGRATRFTSGWGYVRMDFPSIDGLELSRTDFAPDGERAALLGLHVRNPGAARTVTIRVDAHSELLNHYPWAWTAPSSANTNGDDTGAYDNGALVFREHTGAHDWAALVGSDQAPTAGRDIRLGGGTIDVSASRGARSYATKVDTGDAPVRRLYIGHTVPSDATVRSVKLDGRTVRWRSRETNRGLEITVRTAPGAHRLSVATAPA